MDEGKLAFLVVVWLTVLTSLQTPPTHRASCPTSPRKAMIKDYQQLWKDVTNTTDEAEAIQILAEIVSNSDGRAFTGGSEGTAFQYWKDAPRCLCFSMSEYPECTRKEYF